MGGGGFVCLQSDVAGPHPEVKARWTERDSDLRVLERP